MIIKTLHNLFEDFLADRIDLFRDEKMIGEEWIKKRKSVYDLYRDKFNPHRVNQLTAKEFQTFLTFKANKSWTNLPRKCKQVTLNMDKLKKVLKYLQNESIPIEKRLNDVVRGGKFYITGFGKNLATGLLHVFNWHKYGVWNNRSQDALTQLNLLPAISQNFGDSYVRINNTLKNLAELLKTDLVYIDGFLYWLDENEKFALSSRDDRKRKKRKSPYKYFTPSINELNKAKKIFYAREPRALFYNAASELIALSIEGKSSLKIDEALAVLLHPWNQAYYNPNPAISHYS